MKEEAMKMIADVEVATIAYNMFAKERNLPQMTYNSIVDVKYELQDAN